MALCKFGGFIVYGVGNLGGHTFQRSRSGVVMRTGYHSSGLHWYQDVKVIGLFQETRNRWQSLSPAERSAWSALGSRLPVTDWQGGQLFLEGQNFHAEKTIAALELGIFTPVDPFTFDNQIPLVEATKVLIAVNLQSFQVYDGIDYSDQSFICRIRKKTDKDTPAQLKLWFTLPVYTGAFPTTTALYDRLTEIYGALSFTDEFEISLKTVSLSGVASVEKVVPSEMI